MSRKVRPSLTTSSDFGLFEPHAGAQAHRSSLSITVWPGSIGRPSASVRLASFSTSGRSATGDPRALGNAARCPPDQLRVVVRKCPDARLRAARPPSVMNGEKATPGLTFMSHLTALLYRRRSRSRVPVRRLLVGVGGPQQCVSSANAPPISCKPMGSPARSKPQGSDSPQMPARFSEQREDVGQVHLQRVVGLLADLERRRRGGRADRSHRPRPTRLEILLDQRAHLLRLQVVGVVVARDSARTCPA